MAQTTTLKEFESIFPILVEDLLAHSKQYGLPQIALDWYKAVRAPYKSEQELSKSLILVFECKHHRRKV